MNRNKTDMLFKSQSEKKTRAQNLPELNLFSGLLEDGYDLRLKVTGTSMTPFIRSGSVLTLSKVPVSQLRIGDIILCQCHDGSFRLHRLIRIKADALITKGDAHMLPDTPFNKNDYKGKVVCIESRHETNMMQRCMNNYRSRWKNFLIARYHLFKLRLIFIYVRFKSLTVDLT